MNDAFYGKDEEKNCPLLRLETLGGEGMEMRWGRIPNKDYDLGSAPTTQTRKMATGDCWIDAKKGGKQAAGV